MGEQEEEGGIAGIWQCLLATLAVDRLIVTPELSAPIATHIFVHFCYYTVIIDLWSQATPGF